MCIIIMISALEDAIATIITASHHVIRDAFVQTFYRKMPDYLRYRSRPFPAAMLPHCVCIQSARKQNW